MASKTHNFIVSAIVRKIRQEGFRIIYLDGEYKDIGMIKLEIPPKIIRHKPDVVGENENQSFCIGEAKTKTDIFSERTKNQITDFMSIVELDSRNKLVIGITLNARADLEKLLFKLEFTNHKQIKIIYIPQEIIPYEKEISI